MPSRLPRVGVPACIKFVEHHPFHAVGCKYVDAVLDAAGCQPLLIPALGQRQHFDDWLDLLDGVMLTGSESNVAPQRYGQQPLSPEMYLDQQRDATTLPLIEQVVARGLPLLAICRGFQELNVAYGGSLHQMVHQQPGLADHRPNDADPLELQYGPSHSVRLRAGGRLERILDKREIMVNSLHEQGINRLGAGLIADAFADDGLIEAVTVAAAKNFALAVQWHPEWQATESPETLAIFQAFGRACGEQMQARCERQQPRVSDGEQHE